MKNGITAFKVKVTSKSKHRCLSRWYLLNHQVFCYQTWYCDASSWAGVSCKKIRLPFSRSSSQQGPVWSKYDSFYCIFWTADYLATKLGPIIGYHRPERLVEKVDYCFQGQGHSEGSKCRCLSRWYFLNAKHFVTKLGIVMHHNELECHAKKKVVCYFQGHGHSKGSYDQNNPLWLTGLKAPTN